MTKVRIIADGNASRVESSVNAFIKDKKVVDIKYQSSHVSTEFKNGVPVKGSFYDRVLIIYEE